MKKNETTRGVSFGLHQVVNRRPRVKLLGFWSVLLLGVASCVNLGCGGAANPADPPPPQAGPRFTAIASMSSPRSGHTATLLRDGRVLIAGGGNAGANGFQTLATAELFDPTSMRSTPTSDLTTARSSHRAIRLLDGRVLILGGENCGSSRYSFCFPTSAAEVFDPSTGVFSNTGSMITARSNFAATLLQDGRVLVAGGWGGYSAGALSSAEIFDPVTETFSQTGTMTAPRLGAVATTLNDGKVLIAGGVQFTSGNAPLDTAELFDPATGIFSNTSNMTIARRVYAASLLPNGKVILAGGNDASSTLASAEAFDEAGSTFSAVASMTTPRAYHTATQLSDGRILLAGGEIDSTFVPDGAQTLLSSAELFDPASGLFTATASMQTARSGHTATLLQSGEVLVAGGRNQSGTLASVEVFAAK